MKVAIPVHEGQLTMHFGHCKHFALIEIDEGNKLIINEEMVDAPPHEPGLLPRWLAEKGVNTIIAGGIGQKAQELFAAKNINVIIGAPVDTPVNLVKSLMDKTLMSGANGCDH